MKHHRTFLPTLILCATLLMAACQPAARVTQLPVAPAQPTEAAMMDDSPPTEEAMDQATTEDEAMDEPTPEGETMADAPEWFNIALTDVNSGETFTFADFKGQIVLVEQMAAWCTNCLAQQRELVELHSQIGDAAISIAIDVDLNENEDILRRHAQSRGFDWRYAVATPELIRAFVDEFGSSVLNPPSVPMFLIDKEGGVHLLDFGHKTVAYLTEQIQTYQ
jgi:thiol-disulfide isomerase/thioredoxin